MIEAFKIVTLSESVNKQDEPFSVLMLWEDNINDMENTCKKLIEAGCRYFFSMGGASKQWTDAFNAVNKGLGTVAFRAEYPEHEGYDGSDFVGWADKACFPSQKRNKIKEGLIFIESAFQKMMARQFVTDLRSSEKEKECICPVCGKYKFAEFGDFDMCATCGFENDPVEYTDHNEDGGANHFSVNALRIIYFAMNHPKTKLRAYKIIDEFKKKLDKVYDKHDDIDYRTVERNQIGGEMDDVYTDCVSDLSKLMMEVLEDDIKAYTGTEEKAK